MKPKKSWREKLADDKGLPKVCEVRAGRGIRSWPKTALTENSDDIPLSKRMMPD